MLIFNSSNAKCSQFSQVLVIGLVIMEFFFLKTFFMEWAFFVFSIASPSKEVKNTYTKGYIVLSKL